VNGERLDHGFVGMSRNDDDGRQMPQNDAMKGWFIRRPALSIGDRFRRRFEAYLDLCGGGVVISPPNLYSMDDLLAVSTADPFLLESLNVQEVDHDGHVDQWRNYRGSSLRWKGTFLPFIYTRRLVLG
jgi:hypothetical protein